MPLSDLPDDQVTDRVDVTPWLEQKVAAILAHHTEVEREALPGLVSGLPSVARAKLLATQWYTRWTPQPALPEARVPEDEGTLHSFLLGRSRAVGP